MADFLTLEDINSVVAEYYNVPFWTEVNIDIGNASDFTGMGFDYCTVDREQSNNQFQFTISVDNELWQGKCYFIDGNNNYISNVTYSNGALTIIADTSSITCHFYMNLVGTFGFSLVDWIITKIDGLVLVNPSSATFRIYVDSVNPSFEVIGKTFETNGQPMVVNSNKYFSVEINLGSSQLLKVRYNGNGYDNQVQTYKEKVAFVPNFDKLVVGRINRITFQTYPYDTSSIPENTLEIKCDYPCNYVNSTSQGLLRLDVDLRSVTDLKKSKLTLDYIYEKWYGDAKFVFDTEYNVISTESELVTLFENGGASRLGANITLSETLTLSNNVKLLGENKTIDLNEYKIIVPTGKSLTVTDVDFINGKHTIMQEVGSSVELDGCSFTDCTAVNGHGAVIDCDVDLHSLDNPTDFNTVITNCNFNNCDCIILHGGDLRVDKCNVVGKLGNYDYPYFLYQTDGTAVITQSQFSITKETAINEDIKFNSCIFVCGKNATINGVSYIELQKNNIQSFLERNSSTINLTYYYEPIEQNITLQSDKGYCHAVSNKSQIYKTNVEVTREG